MFDHYPPDQRVILEAEYALCELLRARAERLAVEKEYRAARAAILERVRAELEALDVRFADRIDRTIKTEQRAEEEARRRVLEAGQSIKVAGVQAVYTPGRVSWDNEGLEAYAQRHPEVQAYRRVGQPYVTLRYKDGVAAGIPD